MYCAKALGMAAEEHHRVHLNVILIKIHLERNKSIHNESENKINTFASD